MSQPSDVRLMIEELVRVANEHGFLVAGFVFPDPKKCKAPELINFGNCEDASKLELYESLIELWEKHRSRANHIRIGRKN